MGGDDGLLSDLVGFVRRPSVIVMRILLRFRIPRMFGGELVNQGENCAPLCVLCLVCSITSLSKPTAKDRIPLITNLVSPTYRTIPISRAICEFYVFSIFSTAFHKVADLGALAAHDWATGILRKNPYLSGVVMVLYVILVGDGFTAYFACD